MKRARRVTRFALVLILPLLVLLVIVAARAGSGESETIPPANARLANAGFDENGGSLDGWSRRGEKYGRASVTHQPVVSAPGALELVATGPGSSGDKSFMVYQVLEPANYRGKRVHFGAQVQTDGGAVNITLYTPERFANDFFQDLNSGRYIAREATMEVPANASFLSFGIQIFGKANARAYVDDAFVRIEGEDSGAATKAGAAAAAPSTSAPTAGDRATVTIDAAKRERALSPLLFGMHLEWTARGNGLIDPMTGDLNAAAVDALRALQVPLFRFPGGIHADYYDWSAGITPRDRRAEAMNVFTGKTESQAFGTPEFIALRKAMAVGGVGGSAAADALITANAGTGTPEQAAAWARHFEQAGAPARFWEIGNELYLADPDRDQPNGKRIAKTPEQYAADVPRYREAIRAVRGDAKVGIIAHADTGAFPMAPAKRRDWSTKMLDALKSPVDFVSVHDAYAPVILGDGLNFNDEATRARVYRALYAAPQQTADDLKTVASLLDRHEGTTRGVPLAITEMGPLFGYSSKPDMHAAYVDQSRTMAAAVYVASLLDTLLANPRVLMACYTNPIHRWYGSLLTDTERGLIKTPTYYVYSFFRTRFEPQLVATSVSGPTFDSTTVGVVKAQADVPTVVAQASVSDDGSRLSAVLVNRSLDRTITTRVQIAGFVPARTDCEMLSAASPNAINAPGLTATTVHDQAIAPKPLACQAGTDISIALPPSSIVSLRAERAAERTK